jgi:hypothetical protein
MARSTQPQLIGQLKTNKDGSKRWVMTVWALDGGHTRLIAVKADVVAKNAISGEEVTQLPLMDARGNLV